MSRIGRPKGTKQSPEALAKISRASAIRWQDPEYRAHHLQRLVEARAAKAAKQTPKPPKGPRAKRSAETNEKIRATLKKRWQEPEFRARHLPHTLAIQAIAAKLYPPPPGRPVVRPPEGTPERALYRKIAEILGAEAARLLNLSAETEGAGRP